MRRSVLSENISAIFRALNWHQIRSANRATTRLRPDFMTIAARVALILALPYCSQLSRGNAASHEFQILAVPSAICL